MANSNFLERYAGLQKLSREDLDAVWKHYDADGSGFIEVGPELERFLGDLLSAGGMEASEREVAEFIEGVLEMFDLDANAKLDFKEVEELLNG
ncbi:hypothetical protein PPSIR1_03358 [Plesiocystis pacifica SIR-1]|uniref:EF-hand domain-containing protein n=1 Tax=Plesiocystis pacifica SIR-1 TaxID=391625 RepID=A6G5D1_9BACT|nr:EF-hand domain-containing protein [Plesiocystis pacifica]EDM78874.1 hypothetical protein PPSIR1_03358 [Plesiocystis pacifica SIR-1]